MLLLDQARAQGARRRAALLSASLTLAVPVLAQQAELDRFETDVRPLLARHCQRCHGAEQQKSGLRLDHRDYVLRGGARGPAVVPGEPEQSRLVHAIRYGDVALQMPPRRRLLDHEIATLVRWVELGAPWPDEPRPPEHEPDERFDLERRRAAHWCWRSDAAVEPPPVARASWPRDPLDSFVLARLEAEGLAPAAPADAATLLRRVHFDLTGLPPTPDQLAAFVADPDDAAYERAVDELLASPHFGERWARHWLDLVRYSETLGHEFDFAIPGAWRYRDYVVRALNADVPYDRLVVEHVAGDLMPEPRLGADGGSESALGTMFWWFGEQAHSPVDVRQHTADRIADQIDTLSKAFLGLTVACARCHDHKFDAIPTTDFYALAGVLGSSRYQLRATGTLRGAAAWPAAEKARDELRDRLLHDAHRQTTTLARYLLATASLPPAPALEAKPAEREQHLAAVTACANERGLDADRLARWSAALADRRVQRDRAHPLRTWLAAIAAHGEDGGEALAATWPEARDRDADAGTDPRATDVPLADFDAPAVPGWQRVGEAFGAEPVRDARIVVQRDPALGPYALAFAGGFWHSGAVHPLLTGSLCSPRFPISRRYLHVLVAGRDSRFNVVVEGFQVIRDPIYGSLKQHVDDDLPRWRTIDLLMWQGLDAFLQFQDQPTGDPSDRDYARDGWIAVQRALLSDDARAPEAPRHGPRAALLGAAAPRSLAELADRYADAARRAAEDCIAGSAIDADQARLFGWLSSSGLLAPLAADAVAASARLAAHGAACDAALPELAFHASIADGTGVDQPVFVRGSHRDRGPIAERRFLAALGAVALPSPQSPSGRLALAHRIASPDNPLTARVLVNRLWHHLTGRGLVATADNFGVLGEPPSHPALLDWLAQRFVDDGWSIRRAIRRIVLSSTYRMSSRASSAHAEQVDPNVVLLHRMRVRRASGEVLRDAMLAVSGELDPRLGGPSVPVHLTPFMDDRGRPGGSGPLDGDRRRSIYLEVRRNFLTPFFQAFDTPNPFATVGCRSVSNVPAQALALLNDPFVHDRARAWAARLVPDPTRAVPGDVVERMYLEALARSPSDAERAAALEFVAAGRAEDWADLAHVVFNLKEFLFVP